MLRKVQSSETPLDQRRTNTCAALSFTVTHVFLTTQGPVLGSRKGDYTNHSQSSFSWITLMMIDRFF